MKSGWICLHREITEKSIWVNSTLEQRVILITLLCMANHEPKKWEFKGETYEVQAGQFVTSIKNIAEACCSKEITERKVRTALERFQKLEFLKIETSNKNSLITIVNWNKYQDKDFTDRSQSNVKQMSNKCKTNVNQKSNGCKTDVKRMSTNNNDNNVNNGNNENNVCMGADKPPSMPARFKKPTVEEIQAYCKDRKNGINAQYFWDYYEVRAWKVSGKTPMKDWKAAVRTWEKNGYSVPSAKMDKKADFDQRKYTDEELERHFKT